jgi:hypothetical protein
MLPNIRVLTLKYVTVLDKNVRVQYSFFWPPLSTPQDGPGSVRPRTVPPGSKRPRGVAEAMQRPKSTPPLGGTRNEDGVDRIGVSTTIICFLLLTGFRNRHNMREVLQRATLTTPCASVSSNITSRRLSAIFQLWRLVVVVLQLAQQHPVASRGHRKTWACLGSKFRPPTLDHPTPPGVHCAPLSGCPCLWYPSFSPDLVGCTIPQCLLCLCSAEAGDFGEGRMGVRGAHPGSFERPGFTPSVVPPRKPQTRVAMIA